MTLRVAKLKFAKNLLSLDNIWHMATTTQRSYRDQVAGMLRSDNLGAAVDLIGKALEAPADGADKPGERGLAATWGEATRTALALGENSLNLSRDSEVGTPVREMASNARSGFKKLRGGLFDCKRDQYEQIYAGFVAAGIAVDPRSTARDRFGAVVYGLGAMATSWMSESSHGLVQNPNIEKGAEWRFFKKVEHFTRAAMGTTVAAVTIMPGSRPKQLADKLARKIK